MVSSSSINFFQNFSALMNVDEEVSKAELFELLKYFSKYPFRARDTSPKVRACSPQDRPKMATAALFLTIFSCYYDHYTVLYLFL